MVRFQQSFTFCDTHCVCALQTAKQQLNKDSEEIYPRDFTFADGKKLKIEFQEEVSGWLLSVEPYDREV